MIDGITTFLGFELPIREDGKVYVSQNMLTRHRDREWYKQFILRDELKSHWVQEGDVWVLNLTAEGREDIEDRFKFPERYAK